MSEGFKFEFREDETLVVTGVPLTPVVRIPAEFGGVRVTAIGEECLLYNTVVREVTAPEGLEEVGDRAFEGCTHLTTVTLPRSLRRFGREVFLRCLELSVVRFTGRGDMECDRGSVYKGDALVGRCPGYESDTVRVRSGIRRVSAGSIYGEEITKVRIPDTLTEFDEDAVSTDCPLEEFFCDGGEFAVCDGALYTKGLKELVRCPPWFNGDFAVAVECGRVRAGAFKGCDWIDSIHLHGFMRRIDEGAFDGLASLTRIRFSAGFSATLPLEVRDRKGRTVNGSDLAGCVVDCEGEVPRVVSSLFDKTPFDDDEEKEEDHPATRSVDIPEVSFDDVKGLKDVKEEIMSRVVLPRLKSDLYEMFGIRSGGGVLMYGPPGTGKTMIAQAVATSLGASFRAVSPTDVFDPYVGVAEKRVREIFDDARKHAPSVLFFDDFDMIGSRQEIHGVSNTRNSIICQLLTELQGADSDNDGVTFMAATNRPWIIDSALRRPGRFDVLIHVGLPDAEAREGILRGGFERIPHGEIDYEELVRLTEGFNCADVANLVDRAKRIRVGRIISENAEMVLTMDDVLEASRHVHSTVNPTDLRLIEEFRRNGEVSGPGTSLGDGEQRYVPAERGWRDQAYN